MTLAEKVNLTTGVGELMGPCVGNTGSVPRFGIPVCLIFSTNCEAGTLRHVTRTRLPWLLQKIYTDLLATVSARWGSRCS
jgi:hypothetical protein